MNNTKILELPLPPTIEKGYPIIEIGCGNGDFLVQQALENPNRLFLGCDIKGKRISKTISKIEQNQLKNVFVYKGRGETLLAQFNINSIGGFFMNFPDPWWKKRYHKRRFFYMQQDVDDLVQKITPSGFISFTSDHKDYFLHVFTLLSYNQHIQNVYASAISGYVESNTTPIQTIFAKRWEAAGRKFYHTKFVKQIILS